MNETARTVLENELKILADDLERLNAQIQGYKHSLERDRQRAADLMTRIVDINEALGNPLLTVPVPA